MYTHNWGQLLPPLSQMYVVHTYSDASKQLLAVHAFRSEFDCQCSNVVIPSQNLAAPYTRVYTVCCILQVRKDKLLYFKKKDDFVSQRDPISVILLSRVSNTAFHLPRVWLARPPHVSTQRCLWMLTREEQARQICPMHIRTSIVVSNGVLFHCLMN